MASLSSSDKVPSSLKSKPLKKKTESSPCALFLKQLTALLWKCLITRRRHYISTLFEAIGPLMLPFFAVLLVGGNELSRPDVPHEEYLGPMIYGYANMSVHFEESDFYPDPNANTLRLGKALTRKLTVIYAPVSTETDKLVVSLEKSKVEVIGLENHEQLRKELMARDTKPNGTEAAHLIGIAFRGIDFTAGQLSYTVLMINCSQDMEIAASLRYPVKMNQEPSPFEYQDYLGFVQLVSYVNRDFVHQCSISDIKEVVDHIKMYRMPYPRYRNPMSIFSTFDAVGFATVLSFILLVPLIVKRITDEKSTKAKELLRLIGMSDFVFWTAHFLNYYIMLMVQTVLFVIIFYCVSFYPLISHSSVSVLVAFFLVYELQLVLFAMFVSTIFNRPVIAVIFTVVFWFVTACVIFKTLVLSACNCEVEENNLGRRLSCLLPSGSMLWLFAIMGDLENREVGLRWSNVGSSLSFYKDFTVLNVMLIMVGSCFVYAFLIFYLDNVWPFQHGVPKSPFFLFKPSYWCPQVCEVSKPKNPKLDSKIYEPEPENLAARIEIQDVCKSFSETKPAVNHLWLRIYENQLTVLLGHNGAGKTTTMNMITGMFESTSGTINVNSFNVFTQTSAARRSIGLCPQENIYFSELTVGQHLALFAALKDFPNELVNKEVNFVLDLLKLQDKKNALADSLSGGMKRKLALGIALVGDTETLILDEPTSGMDPEARRVIWDLLISLRRSRTILLTTHYMEEADVLADRIAIMNEGKLCCSGSPLFLKNAYGAGYRLRVAKLESGFNSRRFESTLKSFIPLANFISEVETEVVYSLEGEKAFLLQTFPKLFTEIECHKAKYCIESCGLSYTSLEDVFLTVGSSSSSDFKEKLTKESVSNEPALLLSTQSDLITGCPLLLSQVKGLFLKRFHFSRRYWPMFVLQIIIPSLIITLAMYLDKKLLHKVKSSNSFVLDVEKMYGPGTVTFYDGDHEYYEDFKSLNEEKFHAILGKIPSNSSDPINHWLLDRANSSLNDYIQLYLYGLQVEDSRGFKIWFNNEQYHSLPLSIINLFETLLRFVLPESAKSNARIDVTLNSTMERQGSAGLDFLQMCFSYVLTCLVFMPLAFPFLGASYVMFPVTEQSLKSKLIQLITGLSPATFWIMNFAFDLTTHLIATGILFAVIGLFDNGMFSNSEQSTGSALFMLIFAFGVAAIPLAYALSYFFSTPSSGFVFITVVYVLFGLIANSTFAIINFIRLFHEISRTLTWIHRIGLPLVRLVPVFSFLYGYQKVYLLSHLNGICHDVSVPEQYCYLLSTIPNETISNAQKLMLGCCPEHCVDLCIRKQNAFSLSNNLGAGVDLVYLFLFGLFLMMGIVIYELFKLKLMKWFSRTSSKLNKPQSSLTLAVDSDVEKERIRIDRERSSGKANFTDLLTVHKLSKSFGTLAAVDGLSFGVRQDECFGFLGVNGAGKTTTFSMLTGDLVPSSGNAYINKCSLMGDTNNFRQHLGYCPQFDALLDRLTGDETLYLFARLRGVAQKNMKRDVDNLVGMVGLEEHRSKLTESYSGGTKRKLSIAVSLVGCPSLILLDEPSAGVDPAARRKMWQLLGYIKRNLKSSVVLTSHSMEECEALCSRIAIMVNGQFQCLGATQHLRTKYGQGYSVTIRLKRQHSTDCKDTNISYLERVQKQVQARIPSSVLKDYHQCLMHYHVTDPTETWAHIFTELSALNEQFKFEDYFVADTTLEQIFITFARHQQLGKI